MNSSCRRWDISVRIKVDFVIRLVEYPDLSARQKVRQRNATVHPVNFQNNLRKSTKSGRLDAVLLKLSWWGMVSRGGRNKTAALSPGNRFSQWNQAVRALLPAWLKKLKADLLCSMKQDPLCYQNVACKNDPRSVRVRACISKTIRLFMSLCVEWEAWGVQNTALLHRQHLNMMTSFFWPCYLPTCTRWLMNSIPLCMRQPLQVSHHLWWSHLLAAWCVCVCVSDVTSGHSSCVISPIQWYTHQTSGGLCLYWGCDIKSILLQGSTKTACVFASVRMSLCQFVCTCRYLHLFVGVCGFAFMYARAVAWGNKEIRHREGAFKSSPTSQCHSNSLHLTRRNHNRGSRGIPHWHMTDTARLKGNSTLKWILCTGGMQGKHLLVAKTTHGIPPVYSIIYSIIEMWKQTKWVPGCQPDWIGS